MRLFSVSETAALLLLCLPQQAIAAEQAPEEKDPSSSLRWGPYRPNLYFGVRPQIPNTLLMGLMWANVNDKGSFRALRDTCEQDDKVASYGWTMYDTRVGGVQMIHDHENFVDLKTEFINTPEGDGWGVRVTGVPVADAPTDVATTVIIHLALEGMSEGKSHGSAAKELRCQPNNIVKAGRRISAVCEGSDPALGGFQLRVFESQKNKIVEQTTVQSLKIPEDRIWKAKDVFTKEAKSGQGKKVGLDKPGAGNMHFLQTTLMSSFTIDLVYSSVNSTSPMTPADISSSLVKFRGAFPGRVQSVFPRASPFQGKAYAGFTQYLVSNLLAGLGFFHGDSQVDESHSPAYDESDTKFWVQEAAAMKNTKATTTKPMSLLSHTPSRSISPRGFLGDEGFHLLPIIEWDFDLAITVLQSWMGLMDESGWIGHEQILGPEARSKVPPQFQTQYPHFASPPTLLLLLNPIISKLTGESPYHGIPSVYISSPEASHALLSTLYPKLEKHYTWFRTSQAGNLSQTHPRPRGLVPGEAYRWRGRTPAHCPPSGLDDYPRADPPHPGELHADALAWAGAAADALLRLARHLGRRAEAGVLATHARAARHNLDALHWDGAREAYCDGTVVGGGGGGGGGKGRFARVCRLGYVSLMPFLLGLVGPHHAHVGAALDLMADPERLWGPHGLRSLSRGDALYGAGHWRGAVGVHINVLAVLRLREVAAAGGRESARARTLAGELRERVVRTVYEGWKGTGVVWEQYDDVTGEGRGSKGFTGWTAMALLLMGLEDNGERLEGIHGPGAGSVGGNTWWMPSRALLVAVVVMVVLVVLRKRLVGFWRTRVGLVMGRQRRAHAN